MYVSSLQQARVHNCARPCLGWSAVSTYNCFMQAENIELSRPHCRNATYFQSLICSLRPKTEEIDRNNEVIAEVQQCFHAAQTAAHGAWCVGRFVPAGSHAKKTFWLITVIRACMPHCSHRCKGVVAPECLL